MIEFNDRREDRTRDQRIKMVKSVMDKAARKNLENRGYASSTPVSKKVVNKANKKYKRGK
jgi:hypothetical protein